MVELAFTGTPDTILSLSLDGGGTLAKIRNLGFTLLWSGVHKSGLFGEPAPCSY
jgi:hypothetical protein